VLNGKGSLNPRDQPDLADFQSSLALKPGNDLGNRRDVICRLNLAD